MDNVTQTLVGVALARAGFRRIVPHATLLLILAANSPDLDDLAVVDGPFTWFKIHRGYTHSLIALPLLAFLCVSLTALIVRQKLPWLKAWLVACVGVGSHLFWDWTNPYGIRALLPFSSKWFYLDWNGAYDVVVFTALGLSFLLPYFTNLVSGEIGTRKRQSGQGSAISVLVFLALFECGRWSLHSTVMTALNSRLYDGESPIKVSALPNANNPLAWTGVVETDTAFRQVEIGALELDEGSDSRIFIKPPESAAYKTVNETEQFRYMEYFSRFPVWGFEPVNAGLLVDLADLRFGTPYHGWFHANALLDGNGRLQESNFSLTASAIGQREGRSR